MFLVIYDQKKVYFSCFWSKNLISQKNYVKMLHFDKKIDSFLNSTNIKNLKKKDCQQHPVFPSGHPSKYWLGSTLLNFSDRTRTGVFSVIWPLASVRAILKVFQLHVFIQRDQIKKAEHQRLLKKRSQKCSAFSLTFSWTRPNKKGRTPETSPKRV